MRRIGTRLASLLWSTLSESARRAARQGVLKAARLDARVVSVGNIQVGGAGKTPLVAQIAREAQKRNLSVCILTRGYQSQWERKGGVIAPGNSGSDTQLCGDEAALLHDLCPHAWIGVGADRGRQFKDVVEQAQKKFDLVILDDGFQHWRIKKDLEIVALTSASPFQVLFRDGLKSLKNVDLVVWTKGEVCPQFSSVPRVRINYELPSAPGSSSKSFWLVTGIADGQSAYDLAMQSGYKIVKYCSFPDHAHYEKAEVDEMLRQASQDAAQVILTGKDWVKWRDLGVERSQIIVLEPLLVFKEGREIWLRILWGE